MNDQKQNANEQAELTADDRQTTFALHVEVERGGDLEAGARRVVASLDIDQDPCAEHDQTTGQITLDVTLTPSSKPLESLPQVLTGLMQQMISGKFTTPPIVESPQVPPEPSVDSEPPCVAGITNFHFLSALTAKARTLVVLVEREERNIEDAINDLHAFAARFDESLAAPTRDLAHAFLELAQAGDR